jgi:murein DD-endopeptidase MepM/ murein hydrolase activator NlpD
MRSSLATLLSLFLVTYTHAFELAGEAVQGGLMFGRVEPGTSVSLDDTPVQVSFEGRFVIGFGRDEEGVRLLRLSAPGGSHEVHELAIAPTQYDIEKVDGLPQETVTPHPDAFERIRIEAQMVSRARARRDDRTDYAGGFDWPAIGRISGVYGSQRVLNGTPGRPHYGLDIAAPTGTLVKAPADGIVTLTHPDMYFSGGTIVLDHGQGLSSTFLHLSAILVEAGESVSKGDNIGRIGATGRASGPHLDWRMNWLNRRVNPRVLLPELKEEPLDSARVN